MSYTTDFFGSLKIEQDITEEHRELINKFCSERHCIDMEQGINTVPDGMPGFWCDWEVYKDTLFPHCGTNYRFAEWLQYLIDNFFTPMGYTLAGNIEFYGEDREQDGSITVQDGTVYVTDYEYVTVKHEPRTVK